MENNENKPSNKPVMYFFYILVVTVYKILLSVFGNKLSSSYFSDVLGLLPIIIIPIAKFFEIPEIKSNEKYQWVITHKKVIRHIVLLLVTVLSSLQIFLGEFFDYKIGGVTKYIINSGNIFSHAFLPAVTGALASIFVLWLSLDLTNNSKKQEVRWFALSDVLSISAIVSMLITTAFQSTFQGEAIDSLLIWSLNNLNKLANFTYIFIVLTISIFALLNLLNVYIPLIIVFVKKITINNDSDGVELNYSLSQGKERFCFSCSNLLGIFFVYLWAVACYFTQFSFRTVIASVCVVAEIIGILILFLAKVESKKFMLLIYISQLLMYPIVIFINIPSSNNNGIDLLWPISYLIIFSILFFVYIFWGEKASSENQTPLPQAKRKMPHLCFECTIATIIIILFALYQSFASTNSITTYFVNSYRGDHNISISQAEMIDVTNQFANKYDGKSIAFLSIAANKYLIVANDNYTDIDPICAGDDGITISALFIVEKAAHDGYVMFKSEQNGKYLSCIGTDSKYLKAYNSKYFFNKLCYENYPNPVSAAYARTDNIGHWQEFKVKKNGNYYYIVSNTNYNAFGDSNGCYWTVFLSEKDNRIDIFGNNNPVRSVMVTAGSWEQFLIQDNLGKEIIIF